MDAQIIISALAIVGTLGGSLGGALIGAKSQKNAKNVAKLEKKVEDYKREIASRIYLERVAMRQLHINNVCVSEDAAQQRLRRKVFALSGYSPRLCPSDVDLIILDFDDTFV